MALNISVIIPVYNAAKTIELCIQSLLPQVSSLRDVEILVVDSSNDETPQIVQAYSPSVKLIHLERRLYPGEARNVGIQQAQGDILVTIDADCAAHKDFLNQIIEAHQSESRAIGGAILNGHPDNLTSWSDYFVSASQYFEHSPRRLVQTIGTGNMSYKREVFSKYGFFPNILRAEDVLFHHRLFRGGEKILFDPSIKVYHLYRTELRELILREIRYGKIRRQASSLDPIKIRNIVFWPPFLVFYPALKFFIILKRILGWEPRFLPMFLKTSPRLFLVLMATTLGIFLSYFPYQNADE